MSFNDLLQQIQQDYPQLKFAEADNFSWSSKKQQVSYTVPKETKEESKYSSKLLHELAHALLTHQGYRSDVELLKIESSAWVKATELANCYGLKLNKHEQSESLNSYINWASSRAQCPTCQKNGLQTMQTTFICPNCQNSWTVSQSRFTRTYRQGLGI